ncbi:putative microtubule-associated protein futsch [Abeliophyllum distichum]|uniref:Microtubule-associated protein futsch n=1 Tax=Abeliophyllum distichum TaxID=126358 RepID=A0ABD1Q6N5_9LAMI
MTEVVLKPSSCQNDLPKPDSNGIGHYNHQNDPDNSNAFKNGVNDLSEDLLDNKDVVVSNSSVLTDSELVEVQAVEFDAQSGKLDSKSEKIRELLDGGHDPVEGTNVIFPVENGIPQDQYNSLACEGHDVPNGTNGILPVENVIPNDQQNSLGDRGHGIANATNGILLVENGIPRDEQNSHGVGVQVSTVDTVEEQSGKTENEAEVEIKQVQDQTGKSESNAEDEIEQIQDQNEKTESSVEAEIEKTEDQTESESFPSTIENQESQARDLGLGTQLGDNVELNNLLSDINVSGDANDKCEDHNLGVVSSTKSEVNRGSLDLVTGCIEPEDANEKCEDHNLELASSTKSEMDQGSLDVVTEAVECEDVDDNYEDHTLVLTSSTKSEMDQGSLDVVTEAVECEDVDDNYEDHTLVLTSSTKSEMDQGSLDVVTEAVECEDVDDKYEDHTLELTSSTTSEVDQGSLDLVTEGVEREDANDKCEYHNLGLASSTKSEMDQGSLNVVTEVVECEDANEKYEDHNLELALSTKSEVDQGSLDVVTDAVECESRKIEVGEVSLEDKVEKLAGELVDTSESQVRVTTSMHLDPKYWPPINEEVTKTESDSDVMENQKSKATLGDNVECRIEHGHEAEKQAMFSRRWADMVRAYPRKTKIVHDPVLKENKENSPLSCAEDCDPCPVEPDEHPDCSEESPKAVKSETENDVSLPTYNFPASIAEVHEPQTEIENSNSKSTEEYTFPIDGPKFEINVENNPVVLSCTTKDARSGSENLVLQESEDPGKVHGNGISTAPPNGSTAVVLAGENVSVEAVTRPLSFVRILNFNERKLREQIKHAQLEVDEKTQLRGAIQLEIQKTRAKCQTHVVGYEAAMIENKAARNLVRLKHSEIDSLHSVINRAKNVMTIEDLDSRICNMEHMIQHETLPSKEEKKHEIKQQKQQREKLSHGMGSQDEIQQVLDKREEVEERLKILKNELDDLKDRISKTKEAAMAADRKHEDENRKAEELQAQFRAADDIHQAAYARLQSLRKEHFEKVKNIMELWHTSDEFRKEYVKQNARRTLMKIGALDGSSLGTDEAPPILPGYMNERVDKLGLTPAKAGSIKSLHLELSKPKNSTVTNKKHAKPVMGNGSATVSGEDVINEKEKEAVKSKEEVELERKAKEELRVEAEARLKEQLRLEEIAKAKLALERKKRNAEKAQRRAELRAQKEAEQKEQEREKRLRKKERKKGASAAGEANEDTNVCETAQSSKSRTEIVKETNGIKETNSAAAALATTKRHPKQSKTKYIPPSIVRNRNKKKLQHWMWLILACFIVVALFCLGNTGIITLENHKWGRHFF